MLGKATYLNTEKLYLRHDQVTRDDKQDSVRWSGSCSLRLVELGSEGDPDLKKTWVVRSRSATKEEEPHSYNYAVGCDVGIDCIMDSEVTSGKLKRDSFKLLGSEMRQ